MGLEIKEISVNFKFELAKLCKNSLVRQLNATAQ